MTLQDLETLFSAKGYYLSLAVYHNAEIDVYTALLVKKNKESGKADAIAYNIPKEYITQMSLTCALDTDPKYTSLFISKMLECPEHKDFFKDIL